MSGFSEEFESEFYALYEERRQLYEMALNRVSDSLRYITRDRARHTLAEQRRMRVETGRVKEANRLLVKATLPKYSGLIGMPHEVFVAITDIAGIRITCNTYEDVRRVESAILASETLQLHKGVSSDKAHEDYLAQPKESGYRAVHMLVEVEVPRGSSFVTLPCEVQIRTLLQNAWGELTHEDTFKPEIRVPPLVASLSKRLATALAVLDEIAQDLRDELNKIEKGQSVKEDAQPEPSESPTPIPRVDPRTISLAYQSVFGRVLNVPRTQVEAMAKDLASTPFAELSALESLFSEVREEIEQAYEAGGVLLGDSRILAIASTTISQQLPISRLVAHSVDEETSRIDQDADFAEKYAPGSFHMATVVRVTPRYAIGQVDRDAQAIVSARHLEEGRRRVSLEDYLGPGETIRIQVVNISVPDRRIEARPILNERHATD
jgi:ppGpp synthetase/RelA/SpoT-type nucleotidyltranferase